MIDWKKESLELRAKGFSSRKIAAQVGVHRSTINRYFIKYDRKNVVIPKPAAKILLLDIETAPLLANVWGMFKQNVGLNQLEAHSYMLTWAAKWLGSDTVMGAKLTDYPNYEIGSEDDYLLTADLIKLIDQADIIIAHNLRGFDEKVINTRVLINGLTRPRPYKTIDTLDIAKRNFRFTSNKLDGIAIQLGLSRKAQTGGFELWRGCMQGKEDAWAKMMEYNIQDVFVLEEVYLKLRAWDNRHPNVAMYTGHDQLTCTCCGSTNLIEIDKLAYTGISAFTVYRCEDCGKYPRARQNMLPKNKVKRMLVNVT